MFRIQNIRYIFLLLLLVTTALSYLPVFANVVTFDEGVNPLNKYIELFAIITFILHFDLKKWVNERFLKVFLIYSLIILLIGFVLRQMHISTVYSNEARDIMLSFVFVAIGYSSKLNPKKLGGLLLIFSVALAYATYMQLIQHAGGFYITTLYISYGKNSMGMMCASASVALVIFALETNKKFLKTIIWLLCVFLFILMVSIRARAATLTFLLVLIYLIYKRVKVGARNIEKISQIIFFCLILLILLFVFSNAFQSFGDYFLSSLTKNREGDFTAGRVGLNRYGYSHLVRNPLWGSLSEAFHTETFIHNYFLRQLVLFGIIGSLPIVLLYLFIVFYVLKGVLRNKVVLNNIGFFVFIIPVIISLEEPTFPFSPGTAVAFSYILLGNTLNQRSLMQG